MKYGILGAVLALAAVSGTGRAVAGPIGGTKAQTTVVGARQADVYRVACHGGQLTQVRVLGDGDTDLDLYVYDEAGNLVARDDDSLDFCLVSFVPWRSQVYTIRVVNRGSLGNRYRITVE